MDGLLEYMGRNDGQIKHLRVPCVDIGGVGVADEPCGVGVGAGRRRRLGRGGGMEG